MRPGVPPSINRAETPGIQHILKALGFTDVDPETIDLVLSKLLGPEGIEMGMPPIMGGLGRAAQLGQGGGGLFRRGGANTQIASGVPGALEQSMLRNQPVMHNTQMSPPPAGMLGPGGTEVGRVARPRGPVPTSAGSIQEASMPPAPLRELSQPSAGYAFPPMQGPHGTSMSGPPSGMSPQRSMSMSPAQSGLTGTMASGPPAEMTMASGRPAGVIDRERRMMKMAGAGAVGMLGAAGAVGSLGSGGSGAHSDLPPPPPFPTARAGGSTAGEMFPSLSPAITRTASAGEGMDPKPTRARRRARPPPVRGASSFASSPEWSAPPSSAMPERRPGPGPWGSDEDEIEALLASIGPPPGTRRLPPM